MLGPGIVFSYTYFGGTAQKIPLDSHGWPPENVKKLFETRWRNTVKVQTANTKEVHIGGLKLDRDNTFTLRHSLDILRLSAVNIHAFRTTFSLKVGNNQER